MRHVSLLCLNLLGVVLPAPTAVALFQKDSQTHQSPGSLAKYEHLFGYLYFLLGLKPTATTKSNIMFSVSDHPHPAFHSNLNTHSFPSDVPTQDRRLSRLRQWDVGTSLSYFRSGPNIVTEHTHFRPSKGGRILSSKQSRSTVQDANVRFAHDPSVDFTDSTPESLPQVFSLGFDHADGTDNIVVRHRRSLSRMKQRQTRAAGNAWSVELSSVLSNLGRSSSDVDIVYKNIDTLLGHLTRNNKELSLLARDIYIDEAPSPTTHVGYKMTPTETNAIPQGRRIDDSKESQPNISNHPEQRLQQSPTQGSYFYDVLDDMPTDVSKRSKHFRGDIYALIKQGPRHAQGVPLQNLPRTRTHHKMDRSQYIEQPTPPFQSSSKGTVCDAESDGTIPMRCPSSPDTCLYDAMICDGVSNCPQAEDESFALCVLRHWTFRWFRKFLPATQRQTSP